MADPVDLTFRSRVRAGPDEVWAVASTMAGVNAELRPFVRMRHPRDRTSLEGETIVPGEVAFQSWLLLGGVVPFDRHALALERVMPGDGFDEGDGTTTVTDHLVVQLRLGLLTPLAARIVRFLFGHRHRQLVRRFGAA